MRKSDIVSGALGTAIGTYVLIEGSKMPDDHIMKIGPSYFPSLLAAILITFSIILLIKGIVSRKADDFERMDFKAFPLWRALIALFASLAYAFLLKRLGFIPDTILFTLALMFLLGVRKPLELILVPPLVTAAVWLVFNQLLMITLPVGLLSYLGM